MNNDTAKQINDLLLWSDFEAQKIMKTIADEHNVPVEALAQLVAWEREQQGSIRRHGMNEVFDDVFTNKEYWS